MAQRYPKRLYRSRVDRMLGGVCGGLGEYFDVDPVLMRLVFVAGTVLSGGLGIPAYLVLWILVPKEGTSAASRPAAWRQNTDEIVTEVRRFGSEVGETIRPRRAGPVAGPPVGEAAEPAPPATAPADSSPAAPGMPESGAPSQPPAEPASSEIGGPIDPYPYPREDVVRRRQTWAGIVLMVLGLWLLGNNFRWFWWVRSDLLLPLALLGVGAWLLLRRGREGIG